MQSTRAGAPACPRNHQTRAGREAQVHVARQAMASPSILLIAGRGRRRGFGLGRRSTSDAASQKTAGSEKQHIRSLRPLALGSGSRTGTFRRGDVAIVAHYFASDVHLRFDRPDRDRRFSDWLSRLTPEDSLLSSPAISAISGWPHEAARASSCAARACRGSRNSSAAAARWQSWPATTTPGSARSTSASWVRIVPDPFDLTVFGLRAHVVHGHLLGARRAWKAWMEGPAVLLRVRPRAHAASPHARRHAVMEQRTQAAGR